MEPDRLDEAQRVGEVLVGSPRGTPRSYRSTAGCPAPRSSRARTRSRYSSRVCRRRIAARTRVEPDCTGRCRCLQTCGRSRIASISLGRDVPRMRAREPDPPNPGHAVHRREQSGEVALRIVGRLVVVHDLAEQVNFGPTATDRLVNLGQDLRLRAHPLVPPGLRHHAERAVVVAALDDGHVGLHRVALRVIPSGNDTSSYGLTSIWRDPVRMASSMSAGSLRSAMRADDDVHGPGPPEQRRAILLGQASGHRDHRGLAARTGLAAQLADAAEHLVLGLLANRAGVQDDDVGVGGSAAGS